MRFGILLTLLAICFFLLALGAASWWGAALAGWVTLGAAAPALAYFFDRPGALGKRTDGRLSAAHVIVLLPFFLVTWGAWQLKRLFGEPTYNAVADALYVGRRPTSERELPAGTSLVVDLTAEFAEVAAVRGRGPAGYCCIRALDGRAPPEDEATRAAVRAIAAHEGPIYIHCAVGHGRSAALAAAVLVIRGLAPSVVEAERRMKRVRRVGLNATQRRWAEAMARGPRAAAAARPGPPGPLP